MRKFFLRLWHYVRPYRGRMMLGFLCGVVYALTNGVLIFVIQLVVNLIFGGNTADSVAQRLEKAPSFARPVVEQIISWLPALRGPDSKFGLVLIILTIPTVMLVRNTFAYLN